MKHDQRTPPATLFRDAVDVRDRERQDLLTAHGLGRLRLLRRIVVDQARLAAERVDGAKRPQHVAPPASSRASHGHAW
jgi:hypothetical protein